MNFRIVAKMTFALLLAAGLAGCQAAAQVDAVQETVIEIQSDHTLEPVRTPAPASAAPVTPPIAIPSPAAEAAQLQPTAAVVTVAPVASQTAAPTQKPADTPAPTQKPADTPAPTPVPVTPAPTQRTGLITPTPGLGLITPAPTPPPIIGGTNASGAVSEIIALTNAQRGANGLPALRESSTLMSAANVRAKELFTSFSHTRPDGSRALDISSAAYAENIAYGLNMSNGTIMDGWMNSAGHRGNILNPTYGTLGVGVYSVNSAEGTYMYYVQLFGY